MTLRGFAVGLSLVVAALASAQETETPARRPRPAVTRPASASVQTDLLLRQLADAQRALGEQMQQLRESVEGLQGELARSQDRDNSLEQEVKALRDEVKGLYVESSTLKQEIDAVKDDVGGVNSNVSAFRTFSGLFIAVMILLLAVIFVLTIRR